MKHILLKPEDCPCDKYRDNQDCPVCDWGFCICKVCGGAEGDLIGDDGKENECPCKPVSLEEKLKSSESNLYGIPIVYTERGNNCPLREAAKRLLKLAAMPIEKQKDYVRQWPELGWDGILLARDYMAKNPEKPAELLEPIRFGDDDLNLPHTY